MFRTVTQQLSFLGGVLASVRKLGDLVSKSYERQVSALLQAGETFSAASLTFFQVTVTRLMEARRDVLLEAERIHRSELRKLKRLRQVRDDTVKTLRETLSKVRATVNGAHGRGASDLFLGLEPEMALASPRVLLRFAREAIATLIGPDFGLPDTALPNTQLTPLNYAEEIRPSADAVEAVLDEVDDQRRVTEDAQKVRTTAMEASRKTVIYGSRLLEALFILAGEEFHSKRLRPGVGSSTPAGDPLGDPDEPGDGGDEPPGDGAPAGEEPAGEEPAGEEPAGEEPPSP